MAKTIVSAFHRQEAFQILDSVLASGFDSQRFSVINSTAAAEPLESIMHDLPSIQARLYRNHLLSGDSLLVARVSDRDVVRLIKLLQSTGGQDIEAFDPINLSAQEH